MTEEIKQADDLRQRCVQAVDILLELTNREYGEIAVKAREALLLLRSDAELLVKETPDYPRIKKPTG